MPKALYIFLFFLFLSHGVAFVFLYAKRREKRYLFTVFTFTCLTLMYGFKWAGLNPHLGPISVLLSLRILALIGASLFVWRFIQSRRKLSPESAVTSS